MNLFKISWSNIKSKPLNTSLSVVLLAFGVGIISLLLLLEKQLTEKFNRNIKDIDFVLGAKGSPMQLILANVYHVDAPTGNIKMADAQKIIRNPMVKEAIPLAYGDNYEKWRIVGTNGKYPAHYGCELAGGKLFEQPFEATIGSNVAAETGLKVGDTFISMHGYDNQAGSGDDPHHKEHPFTVVGIFKQSDCAIDNLILTPIQSVWDVHKHEEEHGMEEDADHADHADADHADHDEHADHAEADHDHPDTTAVSSPMMMNGDHDASEEVTAYLLIKRNPLAAMMLANQVRNTNMQLADPAIEMNRLSQNFGLGMDALKAIAIMIMVLSFISVFISLYNSLKERKYELALLRTMGGTRSTLFTLILQEGLILVLIGFAIGMALSRIGLLVLSHYMKENFHYALTDLGMTTGEYVLLGITLLVGIMASLLPALRALRIDISKTLSNG